jgi:hypothetical protein
MAAYSTGGLSRVTYASLGGFYLLVWSRRRLIVIGSAAVAVLLIGGGAFAYVVAGLRLEVTLSRTSALPPRPSASSSPSATSAPTRPPVTYTPPPVACPSTTVLQASQPDPNDPSPRNSAALAYDPLRKQLVLFGGDSGAGYGMGDTWVWNGSRWKVQEPVNSPPGRAYAQMAFDAAHGVVVLFGGNPPSPMDDTWTWDGSNWTERHPDVKPPAEYESAMDYDAALGAVILLTQQTGQPAKTWSWDGTTWHQLHTARSPGIKSPAMAYDPVAKQMVLFDRQKTWTFDGVNWTDAPAQGPSQASLPNMAYDAATRSMVLFADGGQGATWTWDGATWTQRCPAAAPPRLTSTGPMAAMAYDADASVAVVFGGVSASNLVSSATWTWDGTTWTQWHAKP